MSHPHIHFESASYLNQVLRPASFKVIVKDMCAAIKAIAPDCEGIAFRGASGALVAMAICAKMNKLPMMIRKPNEGSHSDRKMEGGHCSSFAIVDDLVETGNTVGNILDVVSNAYGGPHFDCQGVFCYERKSMGCRLDVISHLYVGRSKHEWKDVNVYGTQGASKRPVAE